MPRQTILNPKTQAFLAKYAEAISSTMALRDYHWWKEELELSFPLSDPVKLEKRLRETLPGQNDQERMLLVCLAVDQGNPDALRRILSYGVEIPPRHPVLTLLFSEIKLRLGQDKAVIEILQELENHGFDISQVHSVYVNRNPSPLLCAINYGARSILATKWALEQGMPFSLTGEGFLEDPLYSALLSENTTLFDLILSTTGGIDHTGISIQSRGSKYLTSPIMIGSGKLQCYYLKRLIKDFGLDLDFEDERGRSPICMAMEHGSVKVAREMWKNYGADVYRADRHGVTPIQLLKDRLASRVNETKEYGTDWCQLEVEALEELLEEIVDTERCKNG